jgi:hypothetical protein
MALSEFFHWAVDPRGSTMDQPRKMRTLFLQRAVKLFQTSFVGQICTTQHNGQTFLAAIAFNCSAACSLRR